MNPQRWEHCVMWVRITKMTETEWTYDARAWVGDEEVYHRTLTNMFWSVPLADMGAKGWELIGVTHEAALMQSWVEGWSASTARPVQTNVFFKRPVARSAIP